MYENSGGTDRMPRSISVSTVSLCVTENTLFLDGLIICIWFYMTH